jgi:hypothetical protein
LILNAVLISTYLLTIVASDPATAKCKPPKITINDSGRYVLRHLAALPLPDVIVAASSGESNNNAAVVLPATSGWLPTGETFRTRDRMS